MRYQGITVFVLFFGVALLDALSGGDWPRVAFWVAMGVAFAWLDRWRSRKGATPR